jgi:DNA-binding XRE family transcriptional regulator
MDKNLLKEAREEKGLTQTQLARAMKVSSHTVQSWEGGQKPQQSTQVKLCAFFNKTPEQLGFL